MSGGNIWIQMGDEETPDPGNLTHLASDREQEDRRQEGPGHTGHPGHLHTAHGNMENTFLISCYCPCCFTLVHP